MRRRESTRSRLDSEDHVDEVDDDNAADVAQAELANNFFGRFQVVLRDGLFECSTGTGEPTRVDVNNGHSFRTVNDERATGGQVDLAVHCLGQLLIDPSVREDVLVGDPLVDPLVEFRGQLVYVLLNGGV